MEKRKRADHAKRLEEEEKRFEREKEEARLAKEKADLEKKERKEREKKEKKEKEKQKKMEELRAKEELERKQKRKSKDEEESKKEESSDDEAEEGPKGMAKAGTLADYPLPSDEEEAVDGKIADVLEYLQCSPQYSLDLPGKPWLDVLAQICKNSDTTLKTEYNTNLTTF